MTSLLTKYECTDKARFIILCALLSSCSAVVRERPLQPEVVVIPTSPGEGYIWINDSWHWDSQVRTYQVKRGYWTKPKKRTHIWVEGHWLQTRRGWRYVPGHWR